MRTVRAALAVRTNDAERETVTAVAALLLFSRQSPPASVMAGACR